MENAGNVAELDQVIERTVLKADMFTTSISLDQVVKNIDTNNYQSVTEDNLALQSALDQFEKKYIVDSLDHHAFNKTKTAKALGISLRNLYYKMDKYKIERGAT